MSNASASVIDQFSELINTITTRARVSQVRSAIFTDRIAN